MLWEKRKVTTSSKETCAKYWHKETWYRLSQPYSKEGMPTHKNHPCEWQEVDCYLTRRTLGSVVFQDGYDNVPSFWPWWTTDWWFKISGFNQISIGEKIFTWRSARFRWRSVDTNYFWRQHKEKNGILQKWRWNSTLFTSHSGTFWWDSNRTRTHELRIYLLQVDSHGIPSSNWAMDWFWEAKRKIKPVRQSFWNQRILTEMTRRKKNLMMILQFHRRYLAWLVGNATKVLHVGYDCKKLRFKD